MRTIFTLLLIFEFLFSFGQDSKNVVLLDSWTDTIIPIAVEDARYSDLWGFNYNNQNYCAVGSSRGVEILSVTEDKLSHLTWAPGSFQGYTVVHRDYKVYQNYLYAVCDEGTSTLQIFDLSYLPDSLHKVYDSDTHFTICHNIFIDTLNAKLYACGPDNLGMKILDLTNPEIPTLDVNFTNVNYVHDCYVSNDTAFLNCGFDGLHIYDFSGAMPIQLGVLDFYANQGYNHSGWLSESKTNYAFIDETEGAKIRLCELSDLAQIEVSQTFAPADYTNNVPHNIVILEKLAFVAHYNLGLRIFDLSSSPIKEIAYFDSFYQETDYKLNGVWGVFVFKESNQVLICDRQNGVFLLSFPVDVFENAETNLVLTNTPFIDENSRIIPREYFEQEGLSFSIFASDGAKVYAQEKVVNWMGIPLYLTAGVYAFGVYDSEMKLLESGKFVKAN